MNTLLFADDAAMVRRARRINAAIIAATERKHGFQRQFEALVDGLKHAHPANMVSAAQLAEVGLLLVQIFRSDEIDDSELTESGAPEQPNSRDTNGA